MGNICHKQFLRNEFRRENFSLNFENNSQFLSKDPEDVLEYFHSSIVIPFLYFYIILYYISKLCNFISGHVVTDLFT
jgi:hypothetical protein